MQTKITGIGIALPEGRVEQSEAATAAYNLRRIDQGSVADKKAQLLAVLYRRSGVKNRHSVLMRTGAGTPLERQSFYLPTSDSDNLGPSTQARMERYAVESPKISELACSSALIDAKVQSDQITHIVTVSCSGFSSPGFDLELYSRIGLRPTTARTHVGFMGCHGALNGLRVANAYAMAQPDAKVLLCAVELCTLHHQYTDDPQQMVANSLFADGAAAVVVEASSALELDSGSRENGGLGYISAQSSYVIPNTASMMTWQIGNHGFQMTLSAQVPEIICKELLPWMTNWLEEQGLSIGDIASWAIHPGGPRILSASAEALGLAEDAISISKNILEECGNMSSPTILFILDRMKKIGSPKPVVALAFGPGLVIEAALFR